MSETQPTFKPVAFDPALEAQAAELGFVIPEIEVADKLQVRLGRKDRALQVDEDALLAGVQDIELDNDLKVSLDYLPKDATTSEPEISYWSDKHSHVRISTNPAAEKGIARRANEAFWLGVVVTDELTEGNRPKYDKELKKFKKKYGFGTLLTSIAAGAAVRFGDYTLLEGVIKDSGLLLCEEVAVVWSAILTVYSKMDKRTRYMKTNNYIEKKKLETAKTMAKRFPVLDYTDTLASQI